MSQESFWPTWRSNRLFTLVLTILGAYLIVFVASLIKLNFAKSDRVGMADELPYTITVDGVGKVTATPNIANATMGLQTTKPDVLSAQKENSTKMNAFIDAVKASGVAAADIQTADYSVYPQYSYNPQTGESTVSGYTVSQNVHIKIRDLSKITAVLGKAGEQGLNQVSGLDFTIDDPALLEGQARVKAMDQAKQKAKDIAAGLGVRLIRVAAFSEGSNTSPMPLYAPMAREAAMGVSVPPQVESGSLDVTSNVSITYEIQ